MDNIVNEEICWFIRLIPNGNPLVKLQGEEKEVKLYGIEIPYPIPDQYIDLMTRRLPRLAKPLKCVLFSEEAEGFISAKLLYYGWQDKTGDVWLDLSLTLLEEGLAKVASFEFPERIEYLIQEDKARSNSVGIWRKN